MPTYQYRCTKCDEVFERYQSFTDDPIAKCPLPADRPKGWDGADAPRGQKKCRGVVRKVFGSVGVTFKGSGFYRNDSRAASNGQPDGHAKSPSETKADSGSSERASSSSDTSGGSSSEGSGGESKSDTKSDSKSAAKSEAAKGAKATSAA